MWIPAMPHPSLCPIPVSLGEEHDHPSGAAHRLLDVVHDARPDEEVPVVQQQVEAVVLLQDRRVPVVLHEDRLHQLHVVFTGKEKESKTASFVHLLFLQIAKWDRIWTQDRSLCFNFTGTLFQLFSKRQKMRTECINAHVHL